jgi:hypothetical protein
MINLDLDSVSKRDRFMFMLVHSKDTTIESFLQR